MTTAPVESIASCAARYLRENGFVATANEHGRLIMGVGEVAGLDIPPGLGDRVVAELKQRDVVAPIITSVATGNMTILTLRERPATAHPYTPFDPLFRLWVKRKVPGSVIVLPTPGDESCSWLVGPRGRDRPPFEVVVDLTLDVAQRRSLRLRS